MAHDLKSPAYAQLSFDVGQFAERADRLLGRNHFGPKARAMAWSLTPELLATWQAEARQLGVPDADPPQPQT